nr:phospholipid carrier-dependent glycosyltransferase [Exiguobacterium sp. s150]
MSFFLLLFVSQINNPYLIIVVGAGFIIRLFLSLINAYYWILPSGRNDAVNFEATGWLIATTSTTLAEIFSYPVEFYRKFIAVIYFFFGRNPLLIQHISLVAGVLLIYVVYKMVFEISNHQNASRLAAIIVAFHPGLVQFSVFTRRESLIYFLTALSVYLFIKWFNNGSGKTFFLSIISLIGASVFHSGVIFLGVVYILYYVFFIPKNGKWNISFTKIIISSIILMTVISLGELVFRKIPELSVTEIEETVSRKSIDGRTGYLQNLQPDSVVDLIIQTPVRITYFLLTPFPWQLKSINDLYGFILDVLPMYVFLFFSFKYLKYIRINNCKLYIAISIILLVIILPFAWGTSNYGTALRHRQKVVWLFISLASIGYYVNKKKLKRKD